LGIIITHINTERRDTNDKKGQETREPDENKFGLTHHTATRGDFWGPSKLDDVLDRKKIAEKGFGKFWHASSIRSG
jgi:hypothetical protein